MSYDLMVFDPAAAPTTSAPFMAWYRVQTTWSESHDYNDPDIPAQHLREWFHQMIETFPPMNGPLAADDPDDAHVTDYSLGRSVIYAAFAWSLAKEAHARMMELAKSHGVGFFDVSSSEAAIWIPSATRTLVRMR